MRCSMFNFYFILGYCGKEIALTLSLSLTLSLLGLPHGDEYWHDCEGKEVEVWEQVMNNPDIVTECDVPLRSTMTSRKAQDAHVMGGM